MSNLLKEIVMALPKGVYLASRKDKSQYYRVSITYRNKHISLGSYDLIDEACACFDEAYSLLHSSLGIAGYTSDKYLDFSKWVCLVNFRDNGLYFKTPIYLYNKYFLYYISVHKALKFDVDDLFFYSKHTIMVRNGHMFVADYGMQINILSRYGIHSYSVEGRDYIFRNGDNSDFTYQNIVVINRFFGVERITRKNKICYKSKIHINGDFIIGYYDNEITAAIAYNKAASILNQNGLIKKYPENYIDEISAIEYAKIYNSVRISKKLRTPFI